jgi:hypothetical protein
MNLVTPKAAVMGKLQLTGRNLSRVFNFRSGCVHAMHLLCYGVKLPNLKFKTQPKQLLGYLPLDIAFPPAAKHELLSLTGNTEQIFVFSTITSGAKMRVSEIQQASAISKIV